MSESQQSPYTWLLLILAIYGVAGLYHSGLQQRVVQSFTLEATVYSNTKHCSIYGLLRNDSYSWNRANDGLHHLSLNDCPLPSFQHSDTIECLENKTIVFVGDSVTRYQYLNFVHFLEMGKHPREGCVEPKEGSKATADDGSAYTCNSLSNIWLWTNSTEFYKGTNMNLGGNECCDCYKSQNVVPEKKYEHRVYQKGSTTVVYIWFSKSLFNKEGEINHDGGVKGHWKCKPFKGFNTCPVGECDQDADWLLDLDEALVTVVKPLKPSLLVLNAGLHATSNDWTDEYWDSVSKSAKEAVRPSNGKVIWRTTTATSDNTISRWHDYKAVTFAQQYDIDIMDGYAVTEQLSNIPDAYWNPWHFNDYIYDELTNMMISAECPHQRQRLLMKQGQ